MRRQTATGKVLWHFTLSIDGFVAGPDHGMDWNVPLFVLTHHRIPI